MTAVALAPADTWDLGADSRDPATEFAVDVVPAGERETVLVRGELDVMTSPLLRAILDGVYAREPRRVELDLSGVTFLDASAIATLVAARRRLAARRAVLVLREPSRAAGRVLALTGFDHVVPVVGGATPVRDPDRDRSGGYA